MALESETSKESNWQAGMYGVVKVISFYERPYLEL